MGAKAFVRRTRGCAVAVRFEKLFLPHFLLRSAHFPPTDGILRLCLMSAGEVSDLQIRFAAPPATVAPRPLRLCQWRTCGRVTTGAMHDTLSGECSLKQLQINYVEDLFKWMFYALIRRGVPEVKEV